MMNLFATDVGKNSLNDESPEMNAAISRKKPGFVREKQNVNKNPVNLLCVQHPQQTNWDLGQISCNNMSSLMLIKGIKERLMMMDLVTQMDKAKECVNFALTHQAISKEDKE